MSTETRTRLARSAALILAVGVIGALAADAVGAQDRRRDADAQRIRDAAMVFAELASMGEKGIPHAVLDKAEAIAVFPRPADIPRRRGQGPNTLRTARLLDIRSRGIVSVRRDDATWSPPAFLALAGGTFPQDLDLVLVMVNRHGVESVMRHEFAIDTDAASVPGPVGAAEWTDSQRRADIFSYSRSRGVLEGISLTGAKVQGDTIAHQRFYGKRLTTAAAIAQTSTREPVAAWHTALEKHTSSR